MIDEFNETFEQLKLLIGKENTKKVVGFFEGMNIYFPKRIGLIELHNQIYEELRNGASYQETAAKYGYTKSYIRKIEHTIKTKEKRKWQTQGGTSCVVKNSSEKPEPPIRLAPRETADDKPNDFKQGELFYGI